MLETRNSTTSSDVGDDLQPEYQYIWSQRYIDAPVLRDKNKNDDNDCTDPYAEGGACAMISKNQSQAIFSPDPRGVLTLEGVLTGLIGWNSVLQNGAGGGGDLTTARGQAPLIGPI